MKIACCMDLWIQNNLHFLFTQRDTNEICINLLRQMTLSNSQKSFISFVPRQKSLISYRQKSLISYRQQPFISYRQKSLISYRQKSFISYRQKSVISYRQKSFISYVSR